MRISRFPSTSGSGFSSSLGSVLRASFAFILMYLVQVAAPFSYLLYDGSFVVGGILPVFFGTLHFNIPSPHRGFFAHFCPLYVLRGVMGSFFLRPLPSTLERPLVFLNFDPQFTPSLAYFLDFPFASPIRIMYTLFPFYGVATYDLLELFPPSVSL